LQLRARGADEARQLADQARIAFEEVMARGGIPAREWLVPDRQQLDRDLAALPAKVGRSLTEPVRQLRDAYRSTWLSGGTAVEGAEGHKAHLEAARRGLVACEDVEMRCQGLGRFVR
jgi:hypothetical protein